MEEIKEKTQPMTALTIVEKEKDERKQQVHACIMYVTSAPSPVPGPGCFLS